MQISYTFTPFPTFFFFCSMRSLSAGNGKKKIIHYMFDMRGGVMVCYIPLLG